MKGAATPTMATADLSTVESPPGRRRSAAAGSGALTRCLRDRTGVAAVEFAIILPVMLVIYIGTIDATRGVMASRKVAIVARTIADLVAQQPTAAPIPSSQVQLALSAAAAIMRPFPIDQLTMTVSAITIGPTAANTCCTATVNWSFTQGGTLRSCKTNPTLVAAGVPAAPTNVQIGFATANTTIGAPFSAAQSSYLIVADVSYAYKPIFLQAVPWYSFGAFKTTTYMVPRASGGQVLLATPVTASSGQSGASC